MNTKIFLFLAALITSPVMAQEAPVKSGAWADVSDQMKLWLQTQKQPHSEASCCGLGDAVNVDVIDDSPAGVKVRIVNPRGTEAPVGYGFIVPHDKLVSSNYTEDGSAIAWISYSKNYPDYFNVYCLSVAPKI